MAHTVKVTCATMKMTSRYNKMLFDSLSKNGKKCPICERQIGTGDGKCNFRAITSLKKSTARPKRIYCPRRDG
jgi:hypothetical protein